MLGELSLQKDILLGSNSFRRILNSRSEAMAKEEWYKSSSGRKRYKSFFNYFLKIVI